MLSISFDVMAQFTCQSVNAVGQPNIPDMFSFLKRPKKSKVGVKIVIEPANEQKVIDKDLKSILRPFNLLLGVFLCSKYKIQNDVITANTLYKNLFSVLSLIFIAALYWYIVVNEIKIMAASKLSSFVTLVVFALDAVFVVLGFSINCYTNMIYRHENVTLFLKVENAYKILKVNGKRHIIINSIAAGGLIFVCFSSLLYYFYSFGNMSLWVTAATILSVLMEVTVVYSARFLSLLRHHVKAWIKNVNDFECVGQLEDEAYWVRLSNAFMDIFEAYQLFIKTFGVSVSIFVYFLHQF